MRQFLNSKRTKVYQKAIFNFLFYIFPPQILLFSVLLNFSTSWKIFSCKPELNQSGATELVIKSKMKKARYFRLKN
ncbi:hypothetical protein BpHYR1_045564 [Brachionus plicatilis]|uniref:Uncharacterized protein n=1 Tax=Brachionus plicatilis TaxID=10195 RepID=A0A3M7QM44_BRAPC|nr:hypothetical protein BpHYR1_045564 [Brachionus plicatilis]